MTNHTWDLIKLAFQYYSRGFERIIFMIWGAEIAFLVCYLYFGILLQGTYIPMLPAGYAVGSDTLSGAMVIAGVTAVVDTIWTLLILAVIGMLVGYARYYCVVLSYYDEEKYAAYVMFRGPAIPNWLTKFALGKEAEELRLAAIEECKQKIKEIRKTSYETF